MSSLNTAPQGHTTTQPPSSSVQTELFSSNKLLMGKFYFPHYFRKESPPFHIQIIKECSSSLYTAIQAPRGSAKSTVTTFLDTIHGICLKKERFIVIVQNTYAKAAGSLNNIKYEFRYNSKLVADFQVNMNVKDAEGDTVFSHPAKKNADGSVEPAFMVRVLCKGADQLGSVRGERFGAYRPTLIIVDDIEDDEMVKNPERRLELEKQFNEVLNYAGEAGETRIVVDGTILHDDSLLAKMIRSDSYRRFRKLVYRARNLVNGELRSLWPEKWSLADLAEMEADHPESFAKEMQGDPSSGSMETILRKDFRYWRVEEGHIILMDEDGGVRARWAFTDCRAAIAVDMAWEAKKVSDYSAIVPGLVTPQNDILVDTYIARRGMRPDELEEIIFSMSERYFKLTGKRVQIGFEKAKLEKVMKWFLQEAQRRRNQWLWMKDINWGTQDKIERILGRVGNRYAQHSIYHLKGMGELENQLIRLKSVAHDDICDALGMLPEMLAYAPSVKKPVERDDAFNFMRKQTSIYRAKAERPYVFGQKSNPSIVDKIWGPAKIGL